MPKKPHVDKLWTDSDSCDGEVTVSTQTLKHVFLGWGNNLKGYKILYQYIWIYLN